MREQLQDESTPEYKTKIAPILKAKRKDVERIVLALYPQIYILPEVLSDIRYMFFDMPDGDNVTDKDRVEVYRQRAEARQKMQDERNAEYGRRIEALKIEIAAYDDATLRETAVECRIEIEAREIARSEAESQTVYLSCFKDETRSLPYFSEEECRSLPTAARNEILSSYGEIDGLSLDDLKTFRSRRDVWRSLQDVERVPDTLVAEIALDEGAAVDVVDASVTAKKSRKRSGESAD
jgi:hypothetical protein